MKIVEADRGSPPRAVREREIMSMFRRNGMANPRRVIGIGLLALTIGGLSVATIPFVQSWALNDRARAGAVWVPIADLKPGAWKVVDGRGERFFVIRQPSGKISVLGVPLRNGNVMMPDIHWWHPEYACPDFGLSAFNGQVTSASRFECRTIDEQEAWARHYWIWDSEGRTVGKPANFFADMPSIPFETRDGLIVIKRAL